MTTKCGKTIKQYDILTYQAVIRKVIRMLKSKNELNWLHLFIDSVANI